MLQIKFSSVGMRVLNLECDVLPLSNKSDAISFDDTIRTIFPYDRSTEDNVNHMKGFLVPPYPYKEKSPPMLFITAWFTLSNMFFCSPIQLNKSIDVMINKQQIILNI